MVKPYNEFIIYSRTHLVFAEVVNSCFLFSKSHFSDIVCNNVKRAEQFELLKEVLTKWYQYLFESDVSPDPAHIATVRTSYETIIENLIISAQKDPKYIEFVKAAMHCLSSANKFYPLQELTTRQYEEELRKSQELQQKNAQSKTLFNHVPTAKLLDLDEPSPSVKVPEVQPSQAKLIRPRELWEKVMPTKLKAKISQVDNSAKFLRGSRGDSPEEEPLLEAFFLELEQQVEESPSPNGNFPF